MKLISWNVNGIRACGPKGLIQLVEDESPDILCLQETKAHREQVPPNLQNLGYPHDYWSSATRKGYSGVATFCRDLPKKVDHGLGIERYDSEGRIVHSKHEQFDLYNIYFPNGGSGEVRHAFKQEFLHDLKKLLHARITAGEKIVLVGDYNVAHREMDVHDPVRLSKESGFLPEERKWLESFLEMGFIDTFRHFYPDDKDRYSWWSYREMARIANRGWRIDYICITKNLLKYLESAAIMDEVTGSDHCPVKAEFNFAK